MHSTVLNLVLALVAARTALAIGVSVTPHDSYSSSVGVLGCYIETNRVAYWPGSVDCTNICVKLTNGDRSVNLLRIDQSGGAYDISYDAWSYLQTGETAASNPTSGGGVNMEYEEVEASECASLIYTAGSKLPLSAANSMDYLTSCLASDSWVGNNHILYNIADPLCSLGYDETCTLDLSVSNQPTCPHTLGSQNTLTSVHVYNVKYPTGKCVDASTGDEVSVAVAYANNDVSASAQEAPAAAASASPSSQVADATTLVTAASPSTSSTLVPAAPTTTSTSSSKTQPIMPGVFFATSQSSGNGQQVSNESALSSSFSVTSTTPTTTATITMTATYTSAVPCSTLLSSTSRSASIAAAAPLSSSETLILTTSQTTTQTTSQLTSQTASQTTVSTSSSDTARSITTTEGKHTSNTSSTVSAARKSSARVSLFSIPAISTLSKSTLVVAPTPAPMTYGTVSFGPSASGSGAIALPSTVVVSSASTGLAGSRVFIILATFVGLIAFY